MKRPVNRADYRQAETLLRWFHMEALQEEKVLSWREPGAGFQLFVNDVFDGHITYGELRVLADERLRPVPDTGHLARLGEC